MKKALYGMMLTALLAAGCIPQAPFIWPNKDATSGDQALEPIRKPAPVVRADQVTAENARDKAQQLEDEVEYDREAPLPK
jgi:hypothetical protein